ncbi:MAG: PEP-CTERM sorting domain-containing protein [Pirellula sp.]
MKINIGKSIRVAGVLALACLFASLGSSRLDAAVILTLGDTSAPPSTLGGFTMSPLARTGASFAMVDTTSSSPSVRFDQGVYETKIDAGETPPPGAFLFGSWSHGYKGNVWHTIFSTKTRFLTLTLPTSTKAFYFYVQPVALGNVDILVNYPGSGSSGSILNVGGNAGARFVGLHSNAGEDLTSITISTFDDATGNLGFAVGEFGIFNSGSGGGGGVIPEPTSMAIFGLSGLAFLAKRVTSKRRLGSC